MWQELFTSWTPLDSSREGPVHTGQVTFICTQIVDRSSSCKVSNILFPEIQGQDLKPVSWSLWHHLEWGLWCPTAGQAKAWRVARTLPEICFPSWIPAGIWFPLVGTMRTVKCNRRWLPAEFKWLWGLHCRNNHKAQQLDEEKVTIVLVTGVTSSGVSLGDRSTSTDLLAGWGDRNIGLTSWVYVTFWPCFPPGSRDHMAAMI